MNINADILSHLVPFLNKNDTNFHILPADDVIPEVGGDGWVVSSAGTAENITDHGNIIAVK